MFRIFDNPRTEVCPECGMNHAADVRKKNVTQERIRCYRQEIKLLQKQMKVYDNLALYIIKFAMPWCRIDKTYENMLLEIKDHAQSERMKIKAMMDKTKNDR